MAKLTAKEEKYVHALVYDGLSQRKAYRVAYPSSRNWKDRTVDKRASDLFNKPYILGRFDELTEEMKNKHRDKALWSREESVEQLKWLIRQAVQDIEEKGFRQANSNSMVNAIKELNELEGLSGERKAKIKKMNIENKMLEMQIKELTGDNASNENIKNFLEATKPSSKKVGELFDEKI